MPENDDNGMGMEILAETENYAILRGADMEGQPIYSMELGSVTLHLFQDEWEELVELINAAK